MSMRLLTRRRLGVMLVPVALAASLALGGCGDDAGGTAEDPAPTSGDASPTETPSDGPSEAPVEGPVEFTEVALLSEPAADGESAKEAVVLDTEQARAEFAGQFTDDRMGQAIEAAAVQADVPEGETLLGAVVSVGCNVPERVFVEGTAQGLEITAGKPATVLKECFAPMTTVALVAVDSALV